MTDLKEIAREMVLKARMAPYIELAEQALRRGQYGKVGVNLKQIKAVALIGKRGENDSWDNIYKVCRAGTISLELFRAKKIDEDHLHSRLRNSLDLVKKYFNGFLAL